MCSTQTGCGAVGRLMLAILLLPAAAVAATNLLVATRSTVAGPAAAVTPFSPPPGTNVVFLQPSKPSSGPSSSLMMIQAWRAYEKKDYERVFVAVEACVRLFAARAAKQQALLEDFPERGQAPNYAALNDVATCLFIKGKSLREMRCPTEAKEVFREVIRNYRYAQCWDPKGWFWKVAVAAQDEIHCMDYKVDFGNYSSETLTAKAWKSLQAGRYDAMELYVRKCVELYGEVAREMQSSLADFAVKGQEQDYWALNDVGTCLFIRGKALQRQRKNREAGLVYRELLSEYGFAQCFDPHGWYWKIADEARRNLAFCPSS